LVDIYAITVIAIGSFLRRRGEEMDDKRRRAALGRLRRARPA